MDPVKPSLLRRVLAILVLVLVAAVAIRLVVGLVAGVISAVVWILVVAALVGAGLWARSTLKSAKRSHGVKPPSSATELAAAPSEDPGAVELRRITEQLREQGRR
jgi:membrane protein required for beta-lactamase induction